MENLCVALKILESHSKGRVMITVCVFCKWQYGTDYQSWSILM